MVNETPTSPPPPATSGDDAAPVACKFCGPEAAPFPLTEYDDSGGKYSAVVCNGCGARGPRRDTPAEAVAAWFILNAPAPVPADLADAAEYASREMDRPIDGDALRKMIVIAAAGLLNAGQVRGGKPRIKVERVLEMMGTSGDPEGIKILLDDAAAAVLAVIPAYEELILKPNIPAGLTDAAKAAAIEIDRTMYFGPGTSTRFSDAAQEAIVRHVAPLLSARDARIAELDSKLRGAETALEAYRGLMASKL